MLGTTSNNCLASGTHLADFASQVAAKECFSCVDLKEKGVIKDSLTGQPGTQT